MSWLKGTTLKNTEGSAYLGVTIRKDIYSEGEHVDKIISIANKTLGFLRRNTKIDNTEVKARAVNTLIQPLLDYVIYLPRSTSPTEGQ